MSSTQTALEGRVRASVGGGGGGAPPLLQQQRRPGGPAQGGGGGGGSNKAGDAAAARQTSIASLFGGSVLDGARDHIGVGGGDVSFSSSTVRDDGNEDDGGGGAGDGEDDEDEYEELTNEAGKRIRKKKKQFKRCFRAMWRVKHPWVIEIRGPNDLTVMKCQYCKEFGLNNPWGKGEGCKTLQLSALKTHEVSHGHKKAAAAWASQNQHNEQGGGGMGIHSITASNTNVTSSNNVVLQSAASVTLPALLQHQTQQALHAVEAPTVELHEGPIISVIQLMYFTASHDHAIQDYEALCKLHRFMGTPGVPSSNDEYSAYTSVRAGKEFLWAASEFLIRGQQGSITGSPFFALFIDEGIDRAFEQHVIVYITYLSEKGSGLPLVEFVELLEIADNTPQAIYSALSDLLSRKRLQPSKLVALCTDGSFVMTSARDGLVSKLKRDVPHVLEIHSIGHREALAAGDAAKSLSELDFIDTFASKVFEWAGRSAKRHSELSELLEAFTQGVVEVVQIHRIRWLSRAQVVEKLVQVMPIILERWQVEEVEWYNIATTFQLQFCLNLLADVLCELNKLNKKFQEEKVELTAVGAQLEVTVSALKRRFLRGFEEFGQGTRYLKEFLKQAEGGELQYVDGEGNLHQHLLRFESMPGCNNRGGSIGECKILGQEYVRKVIESLSERFPDNHTYSAAKIFSPKYYPGDEIERERLTSQWLERLLEKFGSHELQEPLVNSERCRQELPEFVSMLASCCERKGMVEAWTFCGEVKDWYASWPNLMHLWQIVMVIPSNTVACERGFSRQHLVRDTTRTHLNLKTLDASMRVSVNGPEMSKVDWRAIFEIWKNAKDRRPLRLE